MSRILALSLQKKLSQILSKTWNSRRMCRSTLSHWKICSTREVSICATWARWTLPWTTSPSNKRTCQSTCSRWWASTSTSRCFLRGRSSSDAPSTLSTELLRRRKAKVTCIYLKSLLTAWTVSWLHSHSFKPWTVVESSPPMIPSKTISSSSPKSRFLHPGRIVRTWEVHLRQQILRIKLPQPRLVVFPPLIKSRPLQLSKALKAWPKSSSRSSSRSKTSSNKLKILE